MRCPGCGHGIPVGSDAHEACGWAKPKARVREPALVVVREVVPREVGRAWLARCREILASPKPQHDAPARGGEVRDDVEISRELAAMREQMSAHGYPPEREPGEDREEEEDARARV